MSKKPDSKKKISKDKAKASSERASQQTPDSAKSENPFDFGGLPARDLKKNLGCG